MDFFLKKLCLKTSGLRTIEIREMIMIEITIKISGDVTPPSLNIAIVIQEQAEAD